MIRSRTVLVLLALSLAAALWGATCGCQRKCGVAAGDSRVPPVQVNDARYGTSPQTKFHPWARSFNQEAVAADHAIASEAGAAILKAGGNAVDAAVAASFTLSVVRPYSCGIGGGGFMVIYFADGERAIALNYRETCPAAIGPDFYENRTDPLASTRGALAVATPGTVAGLLLALDRYGTLDRAAVLAPAIAAAREGFIVDAHYAEQAEGLIRQFERRPEWKRRFSFVWTRYLREGRVASGDRITNPEHADALELIAREGADAFYQGAIARAIVAAVARDGGVLTLDDLRGYSPHEAAPLTFAFSRLTFLGMPPPSSGGLAMAQLFGILERHEAWQEAPAKSSAQRTHLIIEAMKHAFADRSRWLGDPAFVPVPVDALLADEYLRDLATRIDLTSTLPPDRYGTAPGIIDEDGGTSHLCVIDRHGNAVACTETINLEFGSLVAVPEFGFCLNNEMDDFTARRGQPNAFGLRQADLNLPEPGKRPLSSMSPTIVLDANGRVAAIAGASGGPRIISATTQVLLSTLVFDVSADNAMASPRFHHQWMPDVLRIEPGFPDSIRQQLEALGHKLQELQVIANAQLIVRTSTGWDAACDPRKGGRPSGR